MGFISSLRGARSATTEPRTKQIDSTSRQARDSSRGLWREVFGQITHKEEIRKTTSVPGGSFARSLTNEASFKRLLLAMRSMAPGGWSDDRWEQTKHFSGVQYVAIHRAGEQLAQSEFQVSIRDPDHPDGKRPVTEHDAPQGPERQQFNIKPYDLVKLLQRPNRQDSFGDLMYRWNQQMGLTGSGLTWMVPSEAGTPMEMYCIPTAIAIPQPAINPDYPDGYYRIQPVYPYGPFSSYPTPASAVGAAIPAQWMLRFMFPHPLLRYEGYAPQTALRLHIDEVESIDRSRWYKMKRTSIPDAQVSFEEADDAAPLTDEQVDMLVAEYENTFQGDHNHGRLFVNQYPGMKLDLLGANPREMDYQASWEQLISFILAGFGVTKPVAGMLETSSYATLFAALKQMHLMTLQPLCSRFSAALTRDLAPFFGDNLIVEIRCPRIDDHELKAGKLSTLISAKAITKNEVRKELDMPLTDEEWGEEIAGEGEEQQQQPGMPGMEEGQLPEEEIANEQPGPDSLGEGSLGPEMGTIPKSLKGRSKSFYDIVKGRLNDEEDKSRSFYKRLNDSLTNGNGNGD